MFEIGEILVVLQKSDVASAKVLESGKSDVEKTRLKKEVEELKKNLEATKREVIDQKAKFDKEKEKLSTEKKNIENGMIYCRFYCSVSHKTHQISISCILKSMMWVFLLSQIQSIK